MVTFRLFGAEKSVLKLVGANLKDGQKKTCWFCSDFSACWCETTGVVGGCFIVGVNAPTC